LVTGATGFAGPPLCRQLKSSGARVIASARHEADGPWEQFRLMDLTSDLPGDLMEGVDTVFHLAGKAHTMGQTAGDAQEHRAVNCEGALRVLRRASEGRVTRFVYFSSVKAFGDSPYGAAKREAEKLVLDRAPAMHTAVLRPALMYGPGWKGNLDQMAESVRAGRFPPLPELGNQRSMVHVDDVARAAILVAEDPRAAGGTYVVTDGESYSTRRIYEAMCGALGRGVPSWTIPVFLLRLAARAGDLIEKLGARFPLDSERLARLTESELYDSSLIREQLGWTPTLTLERAIDEILQGAGPEALLTVRGKGEIQSEEVLEASRRPTAR
jgi:UDP-glucose 4-epimerase